MTIVKDFWQSAEARKHISPPGKEFYEPSCILGLLRTMPLFLVDFGCGVGRLYPYIRKGAGSYLGVDPNEAFLGEAKRTHPTGVFVGLDEWKKEGPRGYDVLANTVLLHIPDEELPGVINTMIKWRPPAVYICEIMEPYRANPTGSPPCYNRSPEDYVEVMRYAGYDWAFSLEAPYTRYKDCNMTLLGFDRRSS